MYLVALDQRQTDGTASVAQAFQLSQWAKEDGHVGKMDTYVVRLEEARRAFSSVSLVRAPHPRPDRGPAPCA